MDTVNVELFGKDPKVQRAISVARNISVTKASVLVVGENGVGKRTLARFIHENSNRASKAFEVVDCSLEPQVVENIIFGHRENGRFNRGALESANGGTIVFANIDCLEDGFQKKLHKVINELTDYEIDVRIIATTSKNLSKLVGAGRFYRGLFIQVSTNNIVIPPLRERTADLEALARHFVADFSGGEMEVSPQALDRILGHYWSQNVDELKSVLENSVGSTEENVLEDIDLNVGEKKMVNPVSDEESESFKLMSLKEAEKLLIRKALVHTSENRTQAAKILGVSIRTLRNKINEYRTEGSSYFVNLR